MYIEVEAEESLALRCHYQFALGKETLLYRQDEAVYVESFAREHARLASALELVAAICLCLGWAARCLHTALVDHNPRTACRTDQHSCPLKGRKKPVQKWQEDAH